MIAIQRGRNSEFDQLTGIDFQVLFLKKRKLFLTCKKEGTDLTCVGLWQKS